ncbi:NmrA-like family domain-containing protein 1 [Durusdinium trenchii]|uniref:NmrA-like family domain-containing protein 1 n=1 Tax=Durusdinium trenchii TaxID=1381693 RepID=A0ABP0QIG2_9DINO
MTGTRRQGCRGALPIVLGAACVGIPGLYLEFNLERAAVTADHRVEVPTPAPGPTSTSQAFNDHIEEPVSRAAPVPQSPAPSRLPEPDTPHGETRDGVNGKYQPKIFAKKAECADQALELGNIPTVEECDGLVATKMDCGRYFMFSPGHPDWLCRCCAPFGEEEGPASDQWNVYQAQVPRLPELGALPPTPPPVDPFAGLPISETRPTWLVRKDALVVDARAEESGGIIILQAVLSDSHSTWGNKKDNRKLEKRPDWLRAILATNRAHAEKHGHVMVIRAYPTEPQLPDWMIKECGKKSLQACIKMNERETYNWEKHLMMSDYLLSKQGFTHVLMLDADAALVQPQLDTLRRIAAILDAEGKDLFLTNEDWLDENGARRINGGLMFAKNAQFTQNLFQDTFDAHWAGYNFLKNARIGTPSLRCTSNEQICLNDLYYGDQEHFTSKVIMASGKQYNRGAERGGEAHIDDETTEIMHWMGGAKGTAGKALCNGKRDLTNGGPNGYGCKRG